MRLGHIAIVTDDLDGEVRALLSPWDCDGVLIEIVQRREAG